MPIIQASIGQIWVKIALYGDAKTGKSFSPLNIAKYFMPGEKVVVIDTENKIHHFAQYFKFDVCPLQNYSLQSYIGAFKECVTAGYKFIIIDSMSHMWKAKDGVLDNMQKIDERNRFNQWGPVNLQIDEFLRLIFNTPCHTICTFRARDIYEWQTNEKTGRKSPVNIGMNAQFKKDSEFEFAITARMDRKAGNVAMTILGSTFPPINGKVFTNPGKEFADLLKSWVYMGSNGQSSTVSSQGAEELSSARHAETSAPPPIQSPLAGDNGKSKEEPKKDLRTEIIHMITEVMDLDGYPTDEDQGEGYREAKFIDILQDLTAWPEKKFYGYKHVKDISDASLGVNYGKVKKYWEEIKAKHVNPPAPTEEVPFWEGE